MLEQLRDKATDSSTQQSVVPVFLAQFQFRPLVNGVPFVGGSGQHR